MAPKADARAADGEGRVELLLFRLPDGQRFALNVLKIREVIPCPCLTKLPGAHPAVLGVVELRELTFSVIDTARAIGRQSMDDPRRGFVVVTDFYRGVQGFLVRQVERIVVPDWEAIRPPPPLGTRYLSGVVEQDGEIIELIDLEQILWEITPEACAGGCDGDAIASLDVPDDFLALVVDDSHVARMQTARYLDALGIPHQEANDGQEAWEILDDLDREAPEGELPVRFLVCDIEMPRLDGYSLTRRLRERPRWRELFILLHTSINGELSEERGRAVGADAVLTKFSGEGLAEMARRALNCYRPGKAP